jgi:bacillithiol biosynthesis cysteine-adding enzyme BshC
LPLTIRHLPADLLHPATWALRAFAERPRPSNMPDVIVPARVEDMPQPTPADDTDDRKDLAQTLEKALSLHEPHVAVIESIRKLKNPRASIVMVGQQPGLLGGPLFNVYKALHAVRLASELEKSFGTPVVPAFWNHADDHDIAEVHHLWVQNPSLDLRKVGLAGVSSGRTPLSRIFFDPDKHHLDALEQVLRQSLPEGEWRERTFELFLPRAGESFSNAFTRILLGLYGHLGLIVVEPQWIRSRLSQSLAQVVGQGIAKPLEAGAQNVRNIGREPAIDPATAALAFRLVDDKRLALRSHGEEFRFDGEAGSRTASELAAEIVQAPEEWSAGALLRPIVQDMALPIAAYVGGLGELNYYAQLGELRRLVDAPGVFVPRLSATLVEDGVRLSLEKIGADAREVFEARGNLGEDEEGGETAPVVLSLRNLGQRMSGELVELHQELAKLDRGLAQQLRKSAGQVRGLVEKLATKAERVHANTQGRGRRHYRRVNNAIYPRGEPQERVRGALEFIVRHGSGWMDELLHEIDPFPTEHLLIQIEQESSS